MLYKLESQIQYLIQKLTLLSNVNGLNPAILSRLFSDYKLQSISNEMRNTQASSIGSIGENRSLSTGAGFTNQRALQSREDSSEKLRGEHRHYHSPSAKLSEYGIYSKAHKDYMGLQFGKETALQHGAGLPKERSPAAYQQETYYCQRETPKSTFAVIHNKQSTNTQADNTKSIKPKSSQYNNSVNRTIVSELLEPCANNRVIDRIIVQNSILGNLRDIPNYETEYYVPQDELKDIRRKHNSNIFQYMAPGRRLEEIFDMEHCQLIRTSGTTRIYCLQIGHINLKLVMEVPHSKERVLTTLMDPNNYRLWNDQVDHGEIKLRICSQNSAITYQKHKEFANWKERDFLYIRHLCQQGDVTYMADRSFTYPDFPPLKSIKREEIQLGLWAFQSSGNFSTKVTYMLQMSYESAGSVEAIIKYMEEMGKLSEYLRATRTSEYFNPNWGISTRADIKTEICSNRPSIPNSDFNDDHYLTAFPQAQWLGSKTGSNRPSVHERESCSFANESGLRLRKEQAHLSSNSKTIQPFEKWEPSNQSLLSMRFEGKVRGSPLQTLFPATSETIPKLILTQTTFPDILSTERLPPVQNTNLKHHRQRQSQPNNDGNFQQTPVQLDRVTGLVVLPKRYLDVRHKIAPVKAAFKLVSRPGWKNYFLKHVWEVLPSGGLLFINKEIKKKQDGIALYLVKTIAQNIATGKSILEIYARSFGFAPFFLERAVSQADPVQRLKLVVAFSVAYFNYFLQMQNQFNPIIGETFQGWVNGCPVYCEQISHHPAISSIYMVGRGYRVFATIEPKVEPGMNSGTLLNEGEFTVQFDSFLRNSVHFQTMKGCLSGLLFGDRTFNFVGKSENTDYIGHFYDDDGHFLELKYNPHKKGMFQIGEQTHPSDWVEGAIVKTSPAFVAKFRKDKKRAGPNKKEMGPAIATVAGRWTESIQVDGKQYYNRQKDQPCEIDQEPYPLHSNCRYREDIVYLRMNDKARAQQEKDRLESIQRADKKLREKLRKKKPL